MRKILSLLVMVAFSVAMFANSYWYRGVDNSWGATAMTVSTDGLYEYIQSSSDANQFKIAASEEGWDYGWIYVQAGFNSTDVTNIGDYSQDNCYCWQSGAYYILVYYPNTAVNTTANPIICASTTLPGAAAEEGNAIKLTFNYYNSTSGDKNNSETTLAGVFDEASLAYVDAEAAKTLDKVYLGRKFKDGNDSIFSNLKLGSSSAAGELKFTLADPTEVDSIVFRAAMYANTEGGDGFSVNGTAFTLTKGKLMFEDKVWKPTGEVSSIDIVQAKANKGRFFLTSITIYPKAATPEPPAPVDSMTVYFYNNLGWENVNAFVWPAEGAAYKEWPGEAAKKEAEQIHGVDVYAYTFPASFVNVIFNNGDAQTANLAWDEDKPYFVPGAADDKGHYTGTWYAKEEIPVPANFYITGSANLVGEEKAWNADAIAVTENAYTFENLAAGDYKLKLTLEGDWNTAIGFDAMTDTTAGLYTDADANINFTLSAAANITVNFIKGEQGITTFTVTGSYFASPVVKLMGIDADWSTGVLLVDAEDHKTASKTLTLAAAYQDFKLVVVTDWYGWGYEPGNQYEIKRDYNFIDILVSKDEPNALKLNADVAGEYTFTYNYVTRKLTVDFPAAPVEMKDLELVVAEESAWDAEGEKLAVWAWVDGNEGAWYATAVENEKLMAHIPAVCDKVIVARFEEDEELIWTKALAQTSNLTFDKCAKVYLSDNGAQFCDWAPEPEPVEVIFTVIVPEGTDSVFIAGTFNGWTTFEKMNAVEGQENKYTITKTIVDVEGLKYKYTSGRSWDYVEVLEGNRTWTELDVVAAWKAVPQPAFEHHDFFITGNAALVGEELAWNPNAIPVDGNSYVLHLGAGKYELKVVTDSCGASNCQQWFGCERLSDEQVEGVACVAATGNIGFTLAEEGDVTVNFVLTETDTIITLTGNFYNVPMVDIKLVPGEVWSLDEAKFAAVIWNVGQTMEYDGVLTGWFVGGDTVVAQIPENTDSIAFARFASEVETPFLNPNDDNFWNHTDKLAVDPSMIFTVMGGDVEGRNFSPGYWGEKPEFIADGYFLLGNFNGWTADADYWFTPYDENQYKVTVALAVNDELKVAKYDRGYRVQWFPNNADNYVVNEKHAGSAQDIYFRPDYQGSQDWYEGCIYVVDNGATAIDNTAIDAKAEKMLRNGMILIIKGDKTYNVMGQIVK